MKHYRDGRGNIFAYEDDGSQDAYIEEGQVLLSDDELAAIRAAQEASSAPTPEQALKAANDKRDELLLLAGLRIAPLQDAVDLGKAKAEDAANLRCWKEYRIAVSDVSDQTSYPVAIAWPEQPA